MVYGGNVAQTLFSSSSGGETVSAAEVTGSPVPYLRSVPDPYDALSPYHDWGPVAIDAAAAAKALHLAGPLIDLMPTPGPSGHNATVTAVGPTTRTTLTGTDVRLALGLRSTWFQVGWLTLVPPPAPVVYGRQGTLDGIARGLAGVTLEAKTPAGAWQRVAAVAPDPSGVFSVVVSPREPTSYRLAAGTSRASPVQVAVAPLVRAAIRGGAFTGTVSPAVAGASVQLQRLDGTAWKSVAPVAVDPAGGFTIRAEPAAGTYRVRYAPGAGFAPGFSPDVLVSP